MGKYLVILLKSIIEWLVFIIISYYGRISLYYSVILNSLY